MRSKGWRYWFNLGFFGLIWISLLAVIGLAIVSFRSTATFLHPQRHMRSENDTPGLYGIPYENIQLISRDGIELAGWYTSPENGTLILVAHGHGDKRPLDQYLMYAQNGYGVLAWDFRAHGESGGEVSTLGYLEGLDVEAALDYGLQQAGVEKIGAWGGSMGGVAVLEAASRRVEIEAVVVDSAFPTLEDELSWVVSNRVFLPFIRFFAEREIGLDLEILRPADRIGEISPRPVLVIQGEDDNVIPEGSALRLYEAAGEPRYLWTEAGAGHVGMKTEYPEEYQKRVVGFFNHYLLGKSE